MNTASIAVYLSLGSNLGNRHHNLKQALKMLAQQVRIVRQSSIYDTAPQDNLAQPRFLNMVIHAETAAPPGYLLRLVKDIEVNLGRRDGPANSPRPIDIDILFYSNIIWQSPDLVIFHPRLTLRSFVLIPLAEIAPLLKHPVTQERVQDMLQKLSLKEQEIYKMREEDTDV